MGTNSRGIDKQLCRWPTSTGQGLEYAGPDALVSPAMEAIVERLPRTVGGRCVHPASTALDDVDDTADNPPIIHASLAPRVSWKMRLELRELFARQPEIVPIHRSLQSVTLNHGSRINESDLWVRTLGSGSDRLSPHGVGGSAYCFEIFFPSGPNLDPENVLRRLDH